MKVSPLVGMRGRPPIAICTTCSKTVASTAVSAKRSFGLTTRLLRSGQGRKASNTLGSLTQGTSSGNAGRPTLQAVPTV